MPLTDAQTARFLNPTGGAGTIFTPFDSRLGTLVAARLTVAGRLVGTLALENTAPQAANVSATLAGRADAGAWFLTPIVDLFSGTAVALGAYDGTADFAGASGVSGLVLDTGEVSREEVYAGDLLHLFDYQTYFQPWMDLNTLTVGGGSVRQSFEGSGEISLSLRYEYTAPAAPPAASPASSFAGTISLTAEAAEGPSAFTTTGPAQRITLDARPAGWEDTVPVARFDPALGTLRAVNIRLAGTLAATADIEAEGFFQTLRQQAALAVSVAGGGAALAELRLDTSYRTMYDFLGTGRFSQALSLAGSTGVTLAGAAAMAPFIGPGALDLSIGSSGTNAFDLSRLRLSGDTGLQTGGRLEVSYTYAPTMPVAPIAMTNVTSGASGTPTPVDYAGPVSGVLHEFAAITTDNIALSAGTDSWYIRTGDGNDAIRASGGTNVLDGGAGSNYLVGGAGQDTFFIDALWVSAPVWSTVANLGPGDSVTMWGVTASYHALTWRDGQGAAGNQGLTLHARAPGGPPASVTLAGYTTADLDNGRLSTLFGSADGIPYLHIAAA